MAGAAQRRALELAIRGAGGVQEFVTKVNDWYGNRGKAKSLHISRFQVYRWKHGEIPADRVLVIEGLTGVSRERLRPDIYPDE